MRAWAQDAPSNGSAAEGDTGSGGAGSGATEPEAAGAAQIDVSPEGLLIKLDSWVDGFIRLLPNIAVALVVLALAFLIGWVVRRAVAGWAARRDRDNLGEVLGGFARVAVLVAGALLALTIVLPTLKAGDLIGGLGIGSVAIGFAFKDILQNWLAGLLILLRQPFRPGDQIVIGSFEGTVDHIETRVTAIRTYDGRLALIPNSDVYTDAVLVNTAFDKRRTHYDIGIGYGDDIGEARAAILKALGTVEGIESEPAPEVLVEDLAASWVTLRARWWTQSLRTDVVHVRARVIEAVKEALDDAGIDMPFDTVVQLFHDQTEETDGRRGAQREGWPGAGDRPPRSRLELTLETVEEEDTAPPKPPARRAGRKADGTSRGASGRP